MQWNAALNKFVVVPWSAVECHRNPKYGSKDQGFLPACVVVLVVVVVAVVIVVVVVVVVVEVVVVVGSLSLSLLLPVLLVLCYQ